MEGVNEGRKEGKKVERKGKIEKSGGEEEMLSKFLQ